MSPNPASRATRRGAVAVLVLICMIPMIGLMSLVLDGGMLLSRKRQVQAVADAAARAAGGSLYSRYASEAGLDPQGKARAAALAIASYNGYANDGTNNSVAVNIPPSSASAGYSGKAGCAEVIITLYQPRYFSAAFATLVGLSSGNIPVKARSVTLVKSTPPSSIILIDPTKAGALTLTGGARLTTNAGVRVNSSSMYNASSSPSGGAVNVSNGAFMTVNGTGTLSIVGNVNMPSWATTGTFFNKAPVSGASAMADPLASVAAPNPATLTTANKSLVPSSETSAPYPSGGAYTLSPGVYNGGLKLNSGGVKYTMTAGLYYMKNGGFEVSNGATLKDNGAGVTIYLDSSGGSVSLQGGTTVTLSAPTTGTNGGIPGIVLFQDRNNTSALNNIANGSTVNMTGALYAPNAAMTIAGGASGASYGTQFIAKSLNLSNGVNVTVTTPTTAGGAVSKPLVVE